MENAIKMNLSFENRVNQLYMRLNEADDEIVDWLRMNCTENTTIKEVANSLYVAPNTIFRLSKKLEYSGFSEMRYALAKEKQQGESKYGLNVVDSDLHDSIGRTLELIDGQVVDRIVSRLREAGKIVVCGMGTNEFFCNLLVMYMHHAGLSNAVFDFDYSVRELTEDDMVFFLSVSGENPRIVKLALEAKQKGATLVSITDVHYNSVQKLSDYNLYYYSDFLKNELAPDYTGLAILVRLLRNALMTGVVEKDKAN